MDLEKQEQTCQQNKDAENMALENSTGIISVISSSTEPQSVTEDAHEEPSTVVTVNVSTTEHKKTPPKSKPKQNLTKRSCPYCSREFSRQRVVDKHMRKCKFSPDADTRDDHVCRHCGKQFSSKWNALRHENLFHTAGANVKKYCRYCGNQFDTRDIVMIHEKICPKKLIPQFRKANVIEWIPVNPQGASELAVPPQSEQNDPETTCQLCGKQFVSKWTAIRHLKNIHSIDTTVDKNYPVAKLLTEDGSKEGTKKQTSDVSSEAELEKNKEVVERNAVDNPTKQQLIQHISETNGTAVDGQISEEQLAQRQMLQQRIIQQMAHVEGNNLTHAEMSTKLTQCIVNLLVSELLPLSIVENCYFKEMLNIACPSFLIPSHFEMFYKVLPEMQTNIQASISDAFKQAEGPLCATVTVNSNWQQKDFLGLTTTFITKQDGGLVTKHVVVTCQLFDGLPETIQKIIAESESVFNMPLYSIVSGSNESLCMAIEQGNFKHVGCMADCLSIVIEESLKKSPGIKDVFKRILQIHDKYRYRLTHHNFQNYESTDNYPLSKLMEDTPTRWSFVYNIISAYTKQKDEFNHLSDIGMMDKIDANMWEALELLEKNLAPFNTATKELCHDYSSIATIIPIIINLRDVLRDMINESESAPGEMAAMKNFVKDLKESFDRRFSFPIKSGDAVASSYNYFNDDYDTFLRFLVATALDPRFKLSLITSDKLKSDCIRKIEVETVGLFSTSVEYTPPPPKQYRPNESVLFRQPDNDNSFSTASGTENDAITAIKSSISSYIASPRIGQDASPLQYWSSTKDECKWFYTVAIKYLTCPPTSVGGEGLIRSVFRKNRNQLQYQELGLMSFLNMNLVETL